MTPHGAWQAQQQQQHAQAQAAYELHREHTAQLERAAAAKRDVEQASTRAMYWSIGGLVFCCGFVPSVVGLVLALKARKAALENELEVPNSATTALVLGVIGVLLGLGVISLGVIDSKKRSTRLEAIEQSLGDSARNAALAQPTACLLAEKRLLAEGWNESNNINDFECDGRLQLTQDRAVLAGMRFKISQTPVTLAACLQKGERWSVVGFSTSECTEPEFQPRK